jgi:hypothetical protein
MTKARSVTQNILMWSHGRGTLQYDIMCALILAFVFFVPPGCFIKQKSDRQQTSQQNSNASSSVDRDNAPRVHVQEQK